MELFSGSMRIIGIHRVLTEDKSVRASLGKLGLSLLFFWFLVSAAQAGCKDAPGPSVDWSGCNKQLLQLDGSDLSSANLDGTFLSGTSFSAVNLASANLRMSELVRTSFARADLSGANLEKSLSSRADFSGATLKGTRLVKAEFLRVSFDGADLSGADLSDGEFSRNSFAKANLSGANLSGAMLQRANFLGANLAGASFKRTYMYWARFAGVDLSQTKDLTQAQIDIACGDAQTKLPAGLTAPAQWPCADDD
jgi:uncharacterized protein YjbI with pentapeptide repeats